MKKIVQLIGIAAVIGLLFFGYTTYPKLDLISGFSAKSIASGHFIDHRSQQMIEQGDNDIDLIDLAQNTIDDAGLFATASVKGLKERKAIYREGLGATLINDDFDTSKPYLVPKRDRSKVKAHQARAVDLRLGSRSRFLVSILFQKNWRQRTNLRCGSDGH